MSDIYEQIESIQKEIRETPYHKGTEHHIGMLRARIARLKDKIIENEAKGGSGGGEGYAIKKHGDATVVLVGPPSVGKSTLINKLTNANSKTAEYSFTTVSVIPGMMDYKNARIQILDVPGLIEGAEVGKGRGREVLSVVRGCDLIVLMTDVTKKGTIKAIRDSLEKNGIRINKTPPKITLKKTVAGGLEVKSNLKQTLSKEHIKAIAAEMGFKNGEITLESKINTEQLIDSLSHNRVYIPAIVVINKADLAKQLPALPHATYLVAEKGEGVEELKEKIYRALAFITVFLIKKDEEPNNNTPVIVKKGTTLQDIADGIGNKFAENITAAQIWGQGAKFKGQEVALSTEAKDGVVVKFV